MFNKLIPKFIHRAIANKKHNIFYAILDGLNIVSISASIPDDKHVSIETTLNINNIIHLFKGKTIDISLLPQWRIDKIESGWDKMDDVQLQEVIK